MEQLVLYVRSQQYLSACFTLAQESIEQGKLVVTQKVYERELLTSILETDSCSFQLKSLKTIW